MTHSERCIGCGEVLSGESCAACGTPARGAKLAVQVLVPLRTPWPRQCACCLVPTAERGEIDRAEIGRTVKASVPMCDRCQTNVTRLSNNRIVLGALSVMVSFIAFSRLLPGDRGFYVGAAVAAVALIALFPVTAALTTKARGHVPYCQAVKFGKGPLNDVTVPFTFHNRAFARLVEDAVVRHRADRAEKT